MIKGFAVNLNNPSILSIISSIFLHANIEHLLSNMLALYVIGSVVEKRFKPVNYVEAYIIFGVIGAYSEVIYHYIAARGVEEYALGASGAISGLGGLAIVLCSSTYQLYGFEKPIIFFRFSTWASLSTGKQTIPFEWHLSFLIMLFQMFIINVMVATSLTKSELLNNKVGIYAHMGGWIGGIILAFLIRFSPKGKGEYYKTLARRKFLAGDWWTAGELLDKANTLLPADPLIALWQARYFQIIGDADNCFKHFKKASQLFNIAGDKKKAKEINEEIENVIVATPDVCLKRFLNMKVQGFEEKGI
ncbi:MAG: rhomboid family intramembrane serine protease [Elusimicrobia bacterium]|nr:rhomboid family intramembrane serine protease [Elusimicrobiota bacterium]